MIQMECNNVTRMQVPGGGGVGRAYKALCVWRAGGNYEQGLSVDVILSMGIL